MSADELSTVLPLFEGKTSFKSTGASTNVVVDFLYIRTVLPWEWRHNKLGISGIGDGRRLGVLSHHKHNYRSWVVVSRERGRSWKVLSVLFSSLVFTE